MDGDTAVDPTPTNGAAEPPAEPTGPSELEVLQGKHRDAQLQAGRLEQQNRALAQEREELATRIKAAEELEANLKADPLKALEHYGHTMQGLTDKVIDSDKNPETPEQRRVRTLEERIEQLTEQLTGTTESIQTKEQQAIRAQRLTAIDEYVDSQGEELGALKALGATSRVLDSIEADAEKRGFAYTDDEVIQTLRDSEQMMWDTIGPQIKGIVALPKGRELLEAALKPEETTSPPDKGNQEATKPATRSGKPKTSITNADTSEVATGASPQRGMSADERYKKAAARVLQNRAARQ